MGDKALNFSSFNFSRKNKQFKKEEYQNRIKNDQVIPIRRSHVVYKIPYRRARTWPSVARASPSASREQRYLAYKVACYSGSWPILGRKLAILVSFFKISTSISGFLSVRRSKPCNFGYN